MNMTGPRVFWVSKQRVKGVLRLLTLSVMLVTSSVGHAQTALAQGTHGCATSGAVPDPANNPGLVWDCETLLGLKDTLRGTTPLNWSANLLILAWEGITVSTVNGAQRVTSLQITEKRLNGRLPPTLGRLNNLRILSLYNHNFGGVIPAELGNLYELQELHLPGNSLNGSIPGILGNLAKLRVLQLGDNNLSGSIPANLGRLTQLETLGLCCNILGGSIPSELGNLSSLKTLSLGFNRLRGSLPPELGKLSSVEWFELDSNELSGSIPPELGNLNSLITLSLSYNHLSGTIPSALGRLTNLQTLRLSTNQLSGEIPPELGNLGNLRSLELHYNQLSGAIPSELGNLSNLQDLVLSGNQLSSSIPASLGRLKNLTYLSLGFNQLSGSIPFELSNITNLRHLLLEDNQLTGMVPPTLINLKSLVDLRLEGNQFTSDFPVEFATLVELPGDRLRIQRNDIPEASFELGIGWISRDGSQVVLVGVIRDQTLGQTYFIARHEGDTRVVRRWISPTSPLVYSVNWPVVNTQFTVPVEIIRVIPLDERLPEPNMLVRRFDGADDRIFAYDATIQQWRHIPDWPTFQALGFYWCDVTAADSSFFDRISIGPPYPATTTPAQDNYPNCRT